MKWEIVEHKTIIKKLGKLPKHIQAGYSYWKRVVYYGGPSQLSENKAFNFEKLKGKRAGQYSCRLSKAYRVIFEIDNNTIKILVLEVNKHEY